MDAPHFTLSDNYAQGIPYQKREENTYLVKPAPVLINSAGNIIKKDLDFKTPVDLELGNGRF